MEEHLWVWGAFAPGGGGGGGGCPDRYGVSSDGVESRDKVEHITKASNPLFDTGGAIDNLPRCDGEVGR